jgi:hypothetical protein
MVFIVAAGGQNFMVPVLRYISLRIIVLAYHLSVRIGVKGHLPSSSSSTAIAASQPFLFPAPGDALAV